MNNHGWLIAVPPTNTADPHPNKTNVNVPTTLQTASSSVPPLALADPAGLSETGLCQEQIKRNENIPAGATQTNEKGPGIAARAPRSHT